MVSPARSVTSLIPKFLLRVLRRVRGTRIYRIGSFDLSLPRDHALPTYRKYWLLYDEPLRLVADSIRKAIPAFRAIDIGANVGDSAALILSGDQSDQTRVLCIEGDPQYLAFLTDNLRVLGSRVSVEPSFVGAGGGGVAAVDLERHRGTTRVVQSSESSGLHALGNGLIPVCEIRRILDKYPTFHGAELLKIDTDGFDLSILMANREILDQTKPVLFFEYLIEHPSDAERATVCMEMLRSIGYCDFLVFDNFGHLLLRTQNVDQFQDLNRYLLSNIRFGRAVHYLDICAVTANRSALLNHMMNQISTFSESSGPTHR